MIPAFRQLRPRMLKHLAPQGKPDQVKFRRSLRRRYRWARLQRWTLSEPAVPQLQPQRSRTPSSRTQRFEFLRRPTTQRLMPRPKRSGRSSMKRLRSEPSEPLRPRSSPTPTALKRHVLPIGIFVAISDGNANVDVLGDVKTIYEGMQGKGASVKELIAPAMGTDAIIEPFRILTYRRLRPFSPTSF